MNFLGDHWRIDDSLVFFAQVSSPSDGSATDATSPPSYRLYEMETGTPILTGSMAKLDDAGTIGFYSEQITLSAANGFEAGKCYCIRVEATVNYGSPNPTGADLQLFRMLPSMTEPSAIPAWPMTSEAALAILAAIATNEMTQNRVTGITTLRNRADSATIGTSHAEDNGTVLTRESFL